MAYFGRSIVNFLILCRMRIVHSAYFIGIASSISMYHDHLYYFFIKRFHKKLKVLNGLKNDNFVLDSERSDECIDFTMMCFFYLENFLAIPW